MEFKQDIVSNDEQILSSVLNHVKQDEPVLEVSEPTQEKLVWTLPGICAKSRVFTSFGELPIEALRERDKVRTGNGNYLPVQWIDQIHLDESFLDYHPDAQPIMIRKGSLGPGKPKKDMLVSSQQEVAALGILGSGGLRSAFELTGRPNISTLPQDGVTYYRFHCGEPAIVNIEGLGCSTSP